MPPRPPAKGSCGYRGRVHHGLAHRCLPRSCRCIRLYAILMTVHVFFLTPTAHTAVADCAMRWLPYWHTFARCCRGRVRRACTTGTDGACHRAKARRASHPCPASMNTKAKRRHHVSCPRLRWLHCRKTGQRWWSLCLSSSPAWPPMASALCEWPVIYSRVYGKRVV